MHLLQGDPEIELTGSAPNPLSTGAVISKIRLDVLLLDIAMPGMDGLTFLRQIKAEAPVPAVICSTLTEKDSTALDALSAGAVAVVAKPRLGLKQFLEDSLRELLRTRRVLAHARPRRWRRELADARRQRAHTCAEGGHLRVFGMLKEPIKLQAVGDILPLESIARAILQIDSRA